MASIINQFFFSTDMEIESHIALIYQALLDVRKKKDSRYLKSHPIRLYSGE